MRTAILLNNNNDLSKVEERLSHQIDMDGMQLPVMLTVMHGECSVHPVNRREFLEALGYLVVCVV